MERVGANRTEWDRMLREWSAEEDPIREQIEAIEAGVADPRLNRLMGLAHLGRHPWCASANCPPRVAWLPKLGGRTAYLVKSI